MQLQQAIHFRQSLLVRESVGVAATANPLVMRATAAMGAATGARRREAPVAAKQRGARSTPSLLDPVDGCLQSLTLRRIRSGTDNDFGINIRRASVSAEALAKLCSALLRSCAPEADRHGLPHHRGGLLLGLSLPVLCCLCLGVLPVVFQRSRVLLRGFELLARLTLFAQVLD
jgi:hypothetical protein